MYFNTHISSYALSKVRIIVKIMLYFKSLHIRQIEPFKKQLDVRYKSKKHDHDYLTIDYLTTDYFTTALLNALLEKE